MLGKLKENSKRERQKETHNEWVQLPGINEGARSRSKGDSRTACSSSKGQFGDLQKLRTGLMGYHITCTGASVLHKYGFNSYDSKWQS